MNKQDLSILSLPDSSTTNKKTTIMRTQPQLYLGTMTFAWTQTSSQVDEVVARKMLHEFSALSDRIDTARIYAGGKTEACLARACAVGATTSPTTAAGLDAWQIGTKAHPSQPGGLSVTGIQSQYETSHNSLPTVFAEYYLHQPDPDHPLGASLQHLHEMKERGLIKAIGMSNYHALEMERAFAIGPSPPSVYQGLYNPLNRMVEKELLPLLQKNNCSFVAYNPLAAGLLSGKYSSPDEASVPPGRFLNNPNYLPRFYTDTNFAAVAVLR
jgi:aflatoxin B1 aldehyde reductase